MGKEIGKRNDPFGVESIKESDYVKFLDNYKPEAPAPNIFGGHFREKSSDNFSFKYSDENDLETRRRKPKKFDVEKSFESVDDVLDDASNQDLYAYEQEEMDTLAELYPESEYDEREVEEHLKNVLEPNQAEVDKEEFHRFLRIRSMLNLTKLNNLQPNIHKKLDAEIADILVKERLIFNYANIIAIDKPYGMTVGTSKVSKNAVDRYIPLMKEELNVNFLKPLHRIDQNCTGCLLFATDPHTFQCMKSKWKSHNVLKTYITITSCIPKPIEGKIDLPLYIGRISGRQKTMPENEMIEGHLTNTSFLNGLEPEYGKTVTNYLTLAVANNTALVECTTFSGFKHQVRAHLAFGSNAPILGDHKYSRKFEFRPQKVAVSTQKALGIVNTKFRHMPLFLHAQEVKLMTPLNGVENILVRAPLPRAFQFIMNKLNLFIK